MKSKKDLFCLLLAELALMFLAAEFIFRLLTFPNLFNSSFDRITMYTFSAALFFAWLFSLLPVKAAKFFTALAGVFFGAYTITQLQFMNFYGSYMSVRASLDGAGRIAEFAGQFISLIKPVYWTALIVPAIVIVVNFFVKVQRSSPKKTFLVTLCGCLLMEGAAFRNLSQTEYVSLYLHPRFIDRAIREFGLGRFLLLDLISLGTGSSSSELILPESTPEPTETPEPEITAEPVITRRDTIDDTAWKALAEAETDEEIRTIDNYLMNRKVTDFNEMTGALRDWNVVYIMIEAFDYMAIDPELTPTLYRMKEEGWDFTHHYTPKFSCATGESEFVSEVSLVPLSDVCTPNQYAANEWPSSIFSVFRNAGYYSTAYHNWKDEFYDRRILYSHSGCEAYLNYDDLKYAQIWGWQSDLEMMELTVPYWIDQDKFFTLYVTSSTHFPYDEGSELGNRYLNEINEVHPEYPIEVKRYLSKSIELDKSMAYLMDQLAEAGKLDNTLLVLFADHHPLETPLQTLADYGGAEVDRLNGFDEDRTPLIFYSPNLGAQKLDRVNSTFDILPTVLNLIGLNYDPRLYVGNDYFDEASKLVIFPNGSWITDDGAYYASNDTHDETLSDAEVARRNTEVNNLFSVCRMIYRRNYFALRPTIPFP